MQRVKGRSVKAARERVAEGRPVGPGASHCGEGCNRRLRPAGRMTELACDLAS